jgi:hypothetical protein
MIDNTKYVKETIAGPPSPVQIVVLQRGWIVVGRVSYNGDDVTITSASVIRKFVTNCGLGGLVMGPTKDTILDKAGIVRATRFGVVLTIDCDEASWSPLL